MNYQKAYGTQQYISPLNWPHNPPKFLTEYLPSQLLAEDRTEAKVEVWCLPSNNCIQPPRNIQGKKDCGRKSVHCLSTRYHVEAACCPLCFVVIHLQLLDQEKRKAPSCSDCDAEPRSRRRRHICRRRRRHKRLRNRRKRSD